MATVAPTCYCGAPARLRTSRFGPFWGCTRYPECDGVVGCHPGTEKPLGELADKATRTARKEAHDAFDALWKPMEPECGRYRRAAYRWLGEELDLDDPHMGEMDRETALAVVEACEGMGPEDLEDWLDD